MKKVEPGGPYNSGQSLRDWPARMAFTFDKKMRKSILLISALTPFLGYTEHERERELIELLGYRERIVQACEEAIALLENTSLTTAKGKEPVITMKEVEEIMNWKTLESELIDFYSTTYTQSELEEMIEFWNSDLGRKTMEAFSGTNYKVTEFLQKQGTVLLQEIQDRIIK